MQAKEAEEMKAKYKQLLKLLEKGRTVQVFVKDLDGFDSDRIRVVEGMDCKYITLRTIGSFESSCFSITVDPFMEIIDPPKNLRQLVQAMSAYDRLNNYTIYYLEVLD